MEQYRAHIMICAGTGCVATGALKVRDALTEELAKRGLNDEVKLVLTGCNGFCAKGPIIAVHPEEIFYQLVKPDDAALLVEEHFVKGRPVEKLMYRAPAEKKAIRRAKLSTSRPLRISALI